MRSGLAILLRLPAVFGSFSFVRCVDLTLLLPGPGLGALASQKQ
jgi:hypothetical protein